MLCLILICLKKLINERTTDLILCVHLHRWRCRVADKELNGTKVEREKVTLEMNYLCWNHKEREKKRNHLGDVDGFLAWSDVSTSRPNHWWGEMVEGGVKKEKKKKKHSNLQTHAPPNATARGHSRRGRYYSVDVMFGRRETAGAPAATPQSAASAIITAERRGSHGR